MKICGFRFTEAGVASVFLFGFALLLTGCGIQQTRLASNASLALNGRIRGGQQPVSNSTIQLYVVGTAGDGSAATPLLTQPVFSDGSGSFSITGTYSCPTPSSLVYLLAKAGNPGLAAGSNNAALTMIAALGACGSLQADTTISVNEVTTIGAVAALAPFMTSSTEIGSASGDAQQLADAFALASQYVNTASGTVPGMFAPVGATVPAAQINTLADILANCINSSGGSAGDTTSCGNLFVLTTPAGGVAPTDTVMAALNLAHDPTLNTAGLFGLMAANAPFQPTLHSVPSDFSVRLNTASSLSVSPSSLVFPDVTVGYVAAAQPLVLSNTGSGSISLTPSPILGPNSGDFATSDDCTNGTVLAGTSCTYLVSYRPTAGGTRLATLELVTGGQTVSIPLIGQAVLPSLSSAPPVNEWNWVGGTNSPVGVGPIGIYGTLGVSSPNNIPGARGSGKGWADNGGNLWMFGGYGLDAQGPTQGTLNDVWKYSLTTREWTWMNGAKSTNAPTVYGTRGVAAAGVGPGARLNGASWTDKNGALWFFGGSGVDAMGNQGDLNDFWLFDPVANVWTWLAGNQTTFSHGTYGTLGTASSTNYPGARAAAAVWTDTLGDFWMFGGNGMAAASGSNRLNDLWRYSLNTHLWTWMSGSTVTDQPGVYGSQGVAAQTNAPGARSDAMSWTDLNGNFWMFGGSGVDPSGLVGNLNDLWEFRQSTLEWTWVGGSSLAGSQGSFGTQGVAASSNAPSSRYGSMTWVDQNGNLWLEGGAGTDASGKSRELSDLWTFNVATTQWTWVGGGTGYDAPASYGILGMPSPTNSPGGIEGAITFVEPGGKLWMFGGYAATSQGPFNVALNALWNYQP